VGWLSLVVAVVVNEETKAAREHEETIADVAEETRAGLFTAPARSSRE